MKLQGRKYTQKYTRSPRWRALNWRKGTRMPQMISGIEVNMDNFDTFINSWYYEDTDGASDDTMYRYTHEAIDNIERLLDNMRDYTKVMRNLADDSFGV